MVQKRASYKRIAIIAVAVVALLIAALVYATRSQPADTSESSTDTSVKDSSDENDATADGQANDETQAPSTAPEQTNQSAVDPALVSTVAIEPMSLVVSYTKGIGGFNYEVRRTPGGTKYVELSSEKLAGTKCTNDIGAFASIIEKPTADESSTIENKTTVEGVEYGLSLSDPTCTSDAALLKQYQDAFAAAFSLLKKMQYLQKRPTRL